MVLGDVLVVKSGEVVPADGIVSSETATLDESALTGESKPSELEQGAPVRSGGTNAGGGSWRAVRSARWRSSWSRRQERR